MNSNTKQPTDAEREMNRRAAKKQAEEMDFDPADETSQNAISDPWRLCCPRCGGHSFRSFSNYWRCQTCDPDQWDTRIEKLKDKKTGRLLSRSEVAGGV